MRCLSDPEVSRWGVHIVPGRLGVRGLRVSLPWNIYALELDCGLAESPEGWLQCHVAHRSWMFPVVAGGGHAVWVGAGLCSRLFSTIRSWWLAAASRSSWGTLFHSSSVWRHGSQYLPLVASRPHWQVGFCLVWSIIPVLSLLWFVRQGGHGYPRSAAWPWSPGARPWGLSLGGRWIRAGPVPASPAGWPGCAGGVSG